MPLYKLTFVFHMERNGWTETWFKTATDHSSALQSALNYRTARAKGLSPPAQIEYVRVSQEGVRGDALVQSTERTIVFPDKDLVSEFGDAPWNGWLTRWQSGVSVRRSLVLRGCPDDWIRFTGLARAAPEPSLLKYFDGLKQSLIQNSFALRTFDPDEPNRAVLSVILDAGATKFTVTFTAPHGFTVPGEVRGLGFPRSTGLNGVRPFVLDTATSIKVTPSKPAVAFDYHGGATFALVKYLGALVTDGQLLRFIHRKTGRRFFVTAGRRALVQ